MDYFQESLRLHEENGGKMEIKSKLKLETIEDLSIAYTPGVAEPCRKIAENPDDAFKYTIKKNLVAVVTDSSAVLGLGNIKGAAGLPVMEGKCLLFKRFAGIDAFPICLETQDIEEIIATVKNIAPTFGGINLEDIAAPRCFEIERRLIEELDIPVFHDDQHGTAIVVLAGLINGLKITNREISKTRFVFSGTGASGVAIAKILMHYGATEIIMCDRKGIIYEGRPDLDSSKQEIATVTNRAKLSGTLESALNDADCFIGVSSAGLVDEDMIRKMNTDPIIFAMANPVPEIMPEQARNGGARIIATGRSDFPNQINNVLAFPGVFRGALDSRARRITIEMKVAAATALANLVKNATAEKFIPSVFDEGVCEAVAEAVKGAM